MFKFKDNEIVPLLLFIVALGSGLIISFCQFIIFVFVYPFSKKVYRKINYYLCFSYYGEVLFLVEWWANVEIEVYVNKDDFEKYYGKEHGFCICNHAYEIDWLLGYMFCNHINILGNVKAYMKKALRDLPIIGWIWYFGDMIVVQRSFEKDKETIRRQISEIVTYTDPCWILIFPEGTRFTEDKHKEDNIYAREKGLPIFKHHLSPRYKGFLTGLKPMRGKVGGLYDITLSFKKDDLTEPTLPNLFYGRKMKAYCYIQRIPLEDVPVDENDAIQFLFELFLKKDKLQDSFLRTGDYFAESGVPRETNKIIVKKSPYILINGLFWILSILSMTLYYFIYCLVTKKYYLFSISIIILLILRIFLNILYQFTQTSRSKKGV